MYGFNNGAMGHAPLSLILGFHEPVSGVAMRSEPYSASWEQVISVGLATDAPLIGSVLAELYAAL